MKNSIKSTSEGQTKMVTASFMRPMSPQRHPGATTWESPCGKGWDPSNKPLTLLSSLATTGVISRRVDCSLKSWPGRIPAVHAFAWLRHDAGMTENYNDLRQPHGFTTRPATIHIASVERRSR